MKGLSEFWLALGALAFPVIAIGGLMDLKKGLAARGYCTGIDVGLWTIAFFVIAVYIGIGLYCSRSSVK